MKNLFYSLFAIALISLTVGCGDDDNGVNNNNNNGTGGGLDDLEMVLTWETVAADLDLAIVDPNGGTSGLGFSFGSEAVSSGDDIMGPGEETITFNNNAPNGNYVVSVSTQDEGITVPFSLKISSQNSSRTFNETIEDDPNVADDDVIIFTVNKNGNTLTF